MRMDKVSESKAPAYFIDLNWFQENSRSFTVIAQRCLCQACRKRFASEPEAMTPASLVTNIRDCCSRAPDFISPKLPLLEKIFRLFLSGGNQPLGLTELLAQFGLYSDNPASLSPQTLSYLLSNNRYYGFRQKLQEKELGAED